MLYHHSPYRINIMLLLTSMCFLVVGHLRQNKKIMLS